MTVGNLFHVMWVAVMSEVPMKRSSLIRIRQPARTSQQRYIILLKTEIRVSKSASADLLWHSSSRFHTSAPLPILALRLAQVKLQETHRPGMAALKLQVSLLHAVLTEMMDNTPVELRSHYKAE
eukprot:jgi/Ulvmu1/8705/UM047_0045.1